MTNDIDLDLKFLEKFLAADDSDVIAGADGVAFMLKGEDFGLSKYPRKCGRQMGRKKVRENG